MSSAEKYEPSPRYHHISGCAGNKYIVQGGVTTNDLPKKGRQQSNSVVDVFDTSLEQWTQEPVSGDLPNPGICGAASVSSLDSCIYTFGGTDGSQYNTLYKLDPESKSWTLLSPQNADGAPMPKCDCGMAILGDSIVIVNGHGLPRELTAPGFMKNAELSDGVWSCPATNDKKHPPCSGITFTAVDERRAVMFGGGNGEQGRMNEVYIFDVSTMNWRILKKSGSWPEGRSSHAACCLNYSKQFPQLLVTEGLGQQCQLLKNAWILDVEKKKWRMLKDTLKGRWGHSLTAMSLGPGLTEVMQFGGASKSQTGDTATQPQIADMTLLQFRLEESSQWEFLSAASNKQIGSEQRIMNKEKLLEWERERGGKGEEEEEEEDDDEKNQEGERKVEKKVEERGMGFINKILAEKVVPIKKEEGVIELKGYGLKIHIDNKTPPKDAKNFLMQMAMSTTEDYELPTDDGVLVSAIYIFDHSLGDRKFCQPVTLQMQHCLSDVSQAELSILWSDDRVPPYHFKSIPGGRFNEIKGYSLVTVDHFSVFGVFYKLVSSLSNPLQFVAMVYYTHIKPGSFKFHLFIVKHLEASTEEVRKSMERDYSKKFIKGATSISEIGAVFQLLLPEKAVSGWTMEHDNHKKMDRRVILSRRPAVPFEVTVKWSGTMGQRLRKLEYRLPIENTTIKIESPDICSECTQVLTRSMTLGSTTRPTSVAERGRKSASVYETIRPEVNDFKKFPPPTLLQLMEVIGVELQTQWRYIGLGLGLKSHTLDTIEAENIKLQDRMTEVFTEWKNQATSEYSWMNLAGVISSKMVNKPALLISMWDQLTYKKHAQ